MAIIGKNIQEAKRFLTEGKLVAIPTETVYGLAGNALNPTAVLAIFDVKNRPSFDPLIIHTDSLEKLENWVETLPLAALKLAEKFWPGPLTLLLPKKKIIPDLVTSGLDTVAVRIPDHAIAKELLAQLDFPLAAPSANPFGYISPTNAQHVADQLGAKIPYILDGGECNVGVESTIVGFADDVPTVYRLGGLALEEIVEVVGEVNLLSHSTSNPQAPGMLKSHYAPRKLLHLKNKEEMEKSTGTSVGLLFFERPSVEVRGEYVRTLSETGELKEAAHHLFAYLRELDSLPVQEIWAEMAPEVGLGRAINDRLRRAAAR